MSWRTQGLKLSGAVPEFRRKVVFVFDNIYKYVAGKYSCFFFLTVACYMCEAPVFLCTVGGSLSVYTRKRGDWHVLIGSLAIGGRGQHMVVSIWSIKVSLKRSTCRRFFVYMLAVVRLI